MGSQIGMMDFNTGWSNEFAKMKGIMKLVDAVQTP